MCEDDKRKTHKLKCHTKYFEAIVAGKKRFTVRYNDRNYNTEDTLILCEYDNEKKEYTGRQTKVLVRDKFNDFGLLPDWVILSIEPSPGGKL